MYPPRIPQTLRTNARMLTRLSAHLDALATFFEQNTHGLIVIDGPMRSGKSGLLVAARSVFHEHVLCAKPARDTRDVGICSRNGGTMHAEPIHTLAELTQRTQGAHMIFFDEAQFSPIETMEHLLACAQTMHVVVAGLDTDFNGNAFAPLAWIKEQAPKTLPNTFLHLKLTGICQTCDNPHATHTKLIAEPPKEGNILIGDAQYLTVCAPCHAQ